MSEKTRTKRSSVRAATWAVSAIVAAGILAPSTARADDDAGPPDARVTGFVKPVDNGGGSTAVTWIGLAFLGILAMSPLFKDAKRTHLD